MKDITIIFILLTSFTCLSSEYFAYPQSKKDYNFLVKKFSAKSIFTKKELSFLNDIELKNGLKFKSNNKEIESIKSNCTNCKIEKNESAKRFNTYISFQWALKNTGKTFKRWISDIDVKYIKAIKGEDIGISGAKENKNINAKIRVAIIDSGVDLEHPDLQGQFYEDKLECRDLERYNLCLKTNNNREFCHQKYANEDHNNNGYPLDCNGWNITGASNPKSEITGNGNINDKDGHGTHIAGIIGAKDNQIGIKGIIQNVELLPVQVGVASQNKTDSELPTDNIAKGILYAIQNKAQIINLSLGWRINQDSLLMRKMINLALKKDILIVAAAGNDSHDETVYPCSYQGVICVASHDVDGRLSTFSNFGAHIDVIAPGNNILSTYPTNKRSRSFTQDNDYEYLSGTSQAAPQVTGLLARLLNKGFNPKEAKAKLLNGTREKTKSQKWIRHGNVSLKKALNASTKISEVITKTPALINIAKNKTFKFKVNVFEETKITISSKTMKFNKSEWIIKKTNNNIELSSSIRIKELDKKSYFIDVHMKSKNFERNYKLQINPIMVISSENTTNNIDKFKLIYDKAFRPDLVKEFKNFHDEQTDYLALKEVNGRYLIQGILKREKSYKSTRPILLSLKKSIIINISKIDIDKDSLPNYIITAVDLSNKFRKTFFKVLDENFELMEYELTPQNEFDNDVTTLPGSFNWSEVGSKMIPTWIGFGKDPLYKKSSPWEINSQNKKVYRIYQLKTKIGLSTVNLKDDNYPIAFLYPSQEHKRSGVLYFLSTKDYGFKKEYLISKLEKNKIQFNTKLNTKNYFDLYNSVYLPMAVTKKTNAFFTIPSSNGSKKVLSIEINGSEIKTRETTLTSLSTEEPLLRVLRMDPKGNAIAQTSNKLITYINNKKNQMQSYTNASRIKHYLLKRTLGVILPEKESFNLSSHALLIDSYHEKIVEPASLQSFGAQGCKEIGIEEEEGSEFLSYFCEENKKIIKLKVSL